LFAENPLVIASFVTVLFDRRILRAAAAFFALPPHSSRCRRILRAAAASFALYKSSLEFNLRLGDFVHRD
jgi:hypothetical protein